MTTQPGDSAPSSLPSLLVSAGIKAPRLPCWPAWNLNHSLWQPREREKASATGRVWGKKRSIHTVNGTLFLPRTEKRKGSFPSGSGERKRPLWAKKPALVVRKENPSGLSGPTITANGPFPLLHFERNTESDVLLLHFVYTHVHVCVCIYTHTSDMGPCGVLCGTLDCFLPC